MFETDDRMVLRWSRAVAPLLLLGGIVGVWLPADALFAHRVFVVDPGFATLGLMVLGGMGALMLGAGVRRLLDSPVLLEVDAEGIVHHFFDRVGRLDSLSIPWSRIRDIRFLRARSRASASHWVQAVALELDGDFRVPEEASCYRPANGPASTLYVDARLPSPGGERLLSLLRRRFRHAH